MKHIPDRKDYKAVGVCLCECQSVTGVDCAFRYLANCPKWAFPRCSEGPGKYVIWLPKKEVSPVTKGWFVIYRQDEKWQAEFEPSREAARRRRIEVQKLGRYVSDVQIRSVSLRATT